MYPRRPLRKPYSHPESSKKPKPKYTKRAIYRSRVTNRMVTATVTALRFDGTVNITINGFRYLGVPTSGDYDPRAKGDKVRCFVQDGQPYVLGKIGNDELTTAPTIFPTEFAQWTWGIGAGRIDKRMFFDARQVGRKTEQRPENDMDYRLRLGIGYGDVDPNLMNGPADLTKQIDIYLERDEWDGGHEGSAGFTLFAIKNNALPNDPTPASLRYQTALTPSDIDFTLEPGELKILTLPDTWRDSIGAATLTTDSIRGFVIEPQGDTIRPDDVREHTYGRFTDLTGALRIHSST